MSETCETMKARVGGVLNALSRSSKNLDLSSGVFHAIVELSFTQRGRRTGNAEVRTRDEAI